MMDETYLVEHIKEQVCFVSADLAADLAAARAGLHRLEYVLPDGVNDQLGYTRPPQPKKASAAERAASREKAAREQARPLHVPPAPAGFCYHACMQKPRRNSCCHCWLSKPPSRKKLECKPPMRNIPRRPSAEGFSYTVLV
jgi:hypothetical protein